jgi:hypothetical protein
MHLQLRLNLLILCLFTLISLNTTAGPGDTTTIRVHDAVHMSWWGQYNVWGVFPPQGTSYRRINLDFTFGCPPTGCSDWDYTVQVEALHKTGTFDSTLVQAPYYTVGTQSPDTIYTNLNPVYQTFFNTTTRTYLVMIHNDPGNPFLITDSLVVYPGNFYNYYHDGSGNIIDSIFIPAANILINSFTPAYNVFEVVERIELARVITPYGGYYGLSWSNTVQFDITDLAPILHDSVQIMAFYGGWSDGFSITLDFHFIEGIPPRTPIRVRNVYSSGPGGFPYGNTNNPIENYLVPKTLPLDVQEENAMLRVIPSGHGAGTQNCAEFCLKNYRIKVDGTQYFQQQIWRNDCGMNHLMHQAGTWLYDRANWCPGEKATVREHELTPLITPGNPVTIDMDIDPYTNSVGSQNPNYIMAAHLITYGAPNFTNDLSVEEIIAPNKHFYYNRYNPICNNPVIAIKNTGANTITSATITYGVKGGVPSVQQWSGNLAFNQSVQVQLGNTDWTSATNTPDQFYAYVSNPNGQNDDYAWNDTMRTYFNHPVQLPYSFVVLFQSNLAFYETTYNIKDDQGNVVFSNGLLAANTLYRDTVVLANGCYTFTINDSGKDGLSFFANNDGNGFIRFVNAFGPGILKYFEADFGTRLTFQFTVGYLLNTPEFEKESRMHVFPNPGSGQITIDISTPQNQSGVIEILDVRGRKLYTDSFHNTDHVRMNPDLSNLPRGVYFVRSVSEKSLLTRKLVLQ